MSEYRTHSFSKDWHDKVENFVEENNLAFDSPKYFIKFCVNKYMDDNDPEKAELVGNIKQLAEALAEDDEIAKDILEENLNEK